MPANITDTKANSIPNMPLSKEVYTEKSIAP